MESPNQNPVVARLRRLLQPEPAIPEPEAAAARLRLTLQMADAGIEMMRLNLRREHPDLSHEEINRLLQEWLLRRPGAEHGDSWGHSVPERFPQL